MVNNRWARLSQNEKAELLGIYTSMGYNDLASIIAHYNSCGGKLKADGGPVTNTAQYKSDAYLYNPPVNVGAPIEVPLRYKPLPDYGDYVPQRTTGMLEDIPIELGLETPQRGYGVLMPDAPSAIPTLDARQDAARRIMAVENSKNNVNGGYDAKTGRWYPHKSHEGGADTIAYGIKLSNGTPEAALALKQGYLTDEQAVSAVDTLVQKYYNDAKKVYDKRFGEGEWDKLSDKSQSILVDYSYNPGLSKFTKLMDAFHSGDKDGILKEYKRYSGKKELGRNKTLFDEIQTLGNEYPIFRAEGGRLYANGGDKKKKRLARLVSRLAEKSTNGLIGAEDVNTILAHPTDYMKHLYSKEELDEMRKRLYSEYYPMGYFNREGIPAASDIMQGKESKGVAKMYRNTMRGAISQNNTGSERMRDAYFAQWLGIPEEDRRYPGVLVPSSYTPSIGSLGNYPVLSISSNAFPDKDNQIVDSYWAAKQLSNSDSTPEYLMPEKGKGENYVVDPHTFLLKDNLQNSKKEWEEWLDDKTGAWYNAKGPELLANGLAAFTVGSGVDPQRGQYISMFDKWDINPFDKNGNVGGGLTARISKVAGIPQNFDATGGIGNPFYIYDRVYLDDYYGVDSRPHNSDELYGGYILPSIVTAEKKANGGRLYEMGGPTGPINPHVLRQSVKQTLLRAIPRNILVGAADLADSAAGIPSFGQIKEIPEAGKFYINALDNGESEYYEDGYIENPGLTFLLDRGRQSEMLQKMGYHPVNDGYYGSVTSATRKLNALKGDAIPIFQRGDDEVDFSEVEPVADKDGNYFFERTSYLGDIFGENELNHASYHPVSFYKHKVTGDIYVRGYDLNDYGKHDKNMWRNLPEAIGNSLFNQGYSYNKTGQTYGDEQYLAEIYDYIGNPFVQRTALVKAPEELVKKYFGDNYASGGKIHIKPENRGKFTALKKRTGHSASWFKAHGTPAQKKMAIFALNARKWKHEDGGSLREFDNISDIF